MKNKSTSVDLLHGPIMKSLILFAIPIFISNLFQQFYNTADTMIVGNYLGETALAAIGAGSPIYEVIAMTAFGIGSGMSIVTGRCFGSGNRERLKKAVASVITIGTAIAVLFTIVAQILARPLLKLMNTPPEIMEEAYTYVSTITLFLSVMIAYNLCSGILRAVGNSVMPLVFLVISSVTNIFLDILFITKFGLGIRGAAIATVISQGLSVVLCVIYIIKYNPMLVPEKKHFHLEKELCIEMLAQGISVGCMNGLVSSGSMILQSGINGLGYLTIAGHTAARKIFMLCNITFSAIAHASSSFCSQNCGANRPWRIRSAVKKILLLDVVMAIVMTVVLFFAAPILVGFVSGSSEEVILYNGSRYLRVVAPFYTMLGALFVFRFALQGIGMKVLPLFSSVIEFLGKILFTWLLIPRFGYTAVIFCEPSMWCLMVLELAIVFYTNPYIKNAYKQRDCPMEQRLDEV